MADYNDNDDDARRARRAYIEDQMEQNERTYQVFVDYLTKNEDGNEIEYDEIFRNWVSEIRYYSNFEKWYFIQLIFSGVMDTLVIPDYVLLYSYKQLVDEIFRVGKLIGSEFDIFWSPTGVEYEVAKEYGKRPDFEDQSLHYMIIKYLEGAEELSMLATEPIEEFLKQFLSQTMVKSARKSAAAAQYSSAQIIDALRKSKGNTTLAAARLLQRH